MALLWSKKIDNTLYEVRTAGASLRLYTNGVFHSQWNDQRPLAGHLWDLLVLPAFLFPKKHLKSALILGVGGGAVIRALDCFFSVKAISGVDLDAQHLYIARKFFGCRKNSIDLIEAEAVSYLKKQRRKYDYIVEDLFIENPSKKRDAIRAVEANIDWFSLLESRLSSRGILVSNFENDTQLNNLVSLLRNRKLNFKEVFSFQSLRYENAIGVFSKTSLDLELLYKNIQELMIPNRASDLLDHFIFQEL